MRHSTRCLTASKPITPRAIASLTAPDTSSMRNTSSSRSTWTNSRLPGLPRRLIGQAPANQRGGLVQRADLPFQQRQIVQRIEDEVFAFIGARMTSDLLGAAG